ncbi:unnamed protein product [Dimorphilus gyrociliatus]|uniref:Uncharacterized protein n=1 Tax=Dimorphilus gyrociliatus TaxID=2664684 RepID=A0A7I8VKT8_9ANNE|nr:unnamed protein product [Dimorphilus gyrociliatus]
MTKRKVLVNMKNFDTLNVSLDSVDLWSVSSDGDHMTRDQDNHENRNENTIYCKTKPKIKMNKKMEEFYDVQTKAKKTQDIPLLRSYTITESGDKILDEAKKPKAPRHKQVHFSAFLKIRDDTGLCSESRIVESTSPTNRKKLSRVGAKCR